MKYLATLLVIVAMLVTLAIAASADPITSSGMSQRDLVQYLTDVQTNFNKLLGQYSSVQAKMRTSTTLANVSTSVKNLGGAKRLDISNP